MIILDTNVVSELMKGARGDPGVRAWAQTLREQPVTTTLNRAELLAGAALLPHGRRRSEMIADISAVLGELKPPLPFTSDCATAYAEVVEIRTRAGRPIAEMDALIAAIARVSGASIATRDVDGFTGIGIEVVNPWAG